MFSFASPMKGIITAVATAATMAVLATAASAATILPLEKFGVASVAANPAYSIDMDTSVNLQGWAGSSLAGANPIVSFVGNWDRNNGGGEQTFKLNFSDLASGSNWFGTAQIYILNPGALTFEVLFKKDSATGSYANLSDQLLFAVEFTQEQLGAYFSSNPQAYAGVMAARIYETTPAAVPLPASGMLLLAGLAGAGAIARRRRS